MTDSLDRLYAAVLAAKHADPRASRTPRLLGSGRAKMAKKLAEEAVEVVIDAMNGGRDAVIRESAELLYHLVVLWGSAGVSPKDVWQEMDRRERLLGIAEKLPKARTGPGERRRIVPPDTRRLPKRHRAAALHRAGRAACDGQCPSVPLIRRAMLLRRIYDWCIGAAGKPHASWIMGALSFGESSILPIPPDVMMIPMSLARPDKTW